MLNVRFVTQIGQISCQFPFRQGSIIEKLNLTLLTANKWLLSIGIDLRRFDFTRLFFFFLSGRCMDIFNTRTLPNELSRSISRKICPLPLTFNPPYMTTCDHFKQETPWDPFQGALEEYPDIQNYVNNFQVVLKCAQAGKSARMPRHFKDSIVVFKKKKLPIRALHSQSNIYDHDLKSLELDVLNENKSRFSCLRCRKFKKKCTRDLPECLNCVSCDELCIYIPRKRKSSVESATVADNDKHERSSSAPNTCPNYSRSGSLSIDAIDTKFLPFDTDETVMKRRLSMPIKLPTSKHTTEQRGVNYGYSTFSSIDNNSNSNNSNMVSSSKIINASSMANDNSMASSRFSGVTSSTSSTSSSTSNSRSPSRSSTGSNLYKLLN